MKKGFSIIEFLIYIAILSMAIVVMGLVSSNISRVGIRNNVIQEVTQNGRFAMQKIGQAIRTSSVIVDPETQGNRLELKDLDNNSTVFYVSKGNLKMTGGGEMNYFTTPATYPGTVNTEPEPGEPEDFGEWQLLNNIRADDGNHAFSVGLTDYTHRLKATNFSFNIPAGATIDGIMVEIERYSTYANRLKDYRVQLLDGDGNLVGDNKANTSLYWPTSWTNEVYGSYNDTWNISPNVDMVNDSDFGVVLSVDVEVSGVGHVDFIRMTTYYTAEGVSSLTTSNVTVDRIFFKKISDDSVQVEMNISSHNPQNLPEYEFNSFFTSSFSLTH